MSNNGKQIRSVNAVEDWVTILDKFPPELEMQFQKVYGDDPEVIEERRNSIKRLAEKFATKYKRWNEMSIVRAPARVNLMGRHIDHQGGFINTIAINKEILLAFSGRKDERINIKNTDPAQFSGHTLEPSSILDVSLYTDWISFTVSDSVKALNRKYPGDWSLYILAIYYRIQMHFSDRKLNGLDCMVGGNISVGSGLSSSSALGVAFAKALLKVNKTQISDKVLIELTGESELFLGFHGGKGDQAAIVSAQKGMVSKIGFFPFHISDISPFPDDLKIIIAFSGLSAKKGGAIKSIYNQRVASYKIAFRMLQKMCDKIQLMAHVRDLTPSRIGLTSKEILSLLAQLPKAPTRKDISEYFEGEDNELLATWFRTHEDPGNYDLIGTILFGISECNRSESFHEILRNKDMDKISTFINASHNGDRLKGVELVIDKLVEGDSCLTEIPGKYACSTKDIDTMVDIVNSVPGTFGAQIAGAGMGGNIVVLAKNGVADNVLTELRKKYYEVKDISFDAHSCVPVAGAGILEKPSK
ncbi:MAG: hypothetical protein H8E64_03920 [Candidatus Marinimicrobia bacterium]|nr:hypothetical protein [Candidatus Neomarinimicrobiota bacterium]